MNGPTPVQLEKLENELAGLLERAHIPGASAGIVYRQELVWSRGFGFANVEKQTHATADTLYELASCSKPFAAVLLMQLVEQGKLSLDDPMAKFNVPQWYEGWDGPARYREVPVLVRHVLSHTSHSTPGETYSYNGNIFADLTYVLEGVTHTSYAQLIVDEILEPTGMTRTVPGQFAAGYEPLLRDLAFPYIYRQREVRPGAYPVMVESSTVPIALGFKTTPFVASPESAEWRRQTLGDRYIPLAGLSAAAGLVSCVTDLAKFDAALDRNTLISAASKELMWTPAVSNSGQSLPYALGWFVQNDDGNRIVWHYGLHPPSISSLYIKLPEKQLSFFLLANTDRLNANTPVGDGNVRVSPFARAFLSAIAFPED